MIRAAVQRVVYGLNDQRDVDLSGDACLICRAMSQPAPPQGNDTSHHAGEGKVLQSGTATAWGLVTVEKLRIPAAGKVRLSVRTS